MLKLTRSADAQHLCLLRHASASKGCGSCCAEDAQRCLTSNLDRLSESRFRVPGLLQLVCLSLQGCAKLPNSTRQMMCGEAVLLRTAGLRQLVCLSLRGCAELPDNALGSLAGLQHLQSLDLAGLPLLQASPVDQLSVAANQRCLKGRSWQPGLPAALHSQDLAGLPLLQASWIDRIQSLNQSVVPHNLGRLIHGVAAPLVAGPGQAEAAAGAWRDISSSRAEMQPPHQSNSAARHSDAISGDTDSLGRRMRHWPSRWRGCRSCTRSTWGTRQRATQRSRRSHTPAEPQPGRMSMVSCLGVAFRFITG